MNKNKTTKNENLWNKVKKENQKGEEGVLKSRGEQPRRVGLKERTNFWDWFLPQTPSSHNFTNNQLLFINLTRPWVPEQDFMGAGWRSCDGEALESPCPPPIRSESKCITRGGVKCPLPPFSPPAPFPVEFTVGLWGRTKFLTARLQQPGLDYSGPLQLISRPSLFERPFFFDLWLWWSIKTNNANKVENLSI